MTRQLTPKNFMPRFLLKIQFYRKLFTLFVDDPAIANLYADLPEKGTLTMSFDGSRFRTGWQGILEFRFKTNQAAPLHQALTAAGVRPGRADAADTHT